jgi:MerR family transcriptional regulator, light-induced transcriptional regulator
MKQALTPKDLAAAIGVSESSLRRWIDFGAIQTYRTVGGHRRIPLAEGLRFVRQTGSTVVRPEALGLPSADGVGPSPDDALFQALQDGDSARAYAIVMGLFVGGEPIASICDGPIRSAMHRVGELWQHDRRGILQEHRATSICIGLLHQLRQSLVLPAANAPLAIGGAPEGDTYAIPSLMVSLVLTDLGFREMNFGANTPCDLLADAAQEQDACMVWLSISVDLPKEQLRQQLHRLACRLADCGTLLVIGGRHATDISLNNLGNVVIGSSMRQLVDVAKGVLTARRGHRPPNRPDPAPVPA